ncbi:hypothetical protein D3C73_1376450 [compost metagenome]
MPQPDFMPHQLNSLRAKLHRFIFYVQHFRLRRNEAIYRILNQVNPSAIGVIHKALFLVYLLLADCSFLIIVR